jgi:protein-ribulosamine 3-kinase
MFSTNLTDFITRQGWGQITDARPLGGGCINDAQLLTTQHGPRLFLKQNRAIPADMFPREADGLRELGSVAGTPRTPQVYLAAVDFLLLEYLAPEPRNPRCWEIFGEQLASLHLHTHPQFGFDADNYIGATPQPNPRQSDGFAFFAEHRLIFQAALARDNGYFSAAEIRQVERLCQRLPELVPEQPASLLHGDLWSGNIHIGPDGLACLIDPAVYYGWAEADLAMAHLFGSLPLEFYTAYESLCPLVPGYKRRFDIYNLYHLLNHLNLFGMGYLHQAKGILNTLTA